MKTTDGSTDPTLVDETAPDGAVRPLEVAGYRIGDLIGRGGMGEVVLADDLRIGRQVAIKRMRGELATGDATARFLREARIQARLEHPAIVPVHELGIDADGRPYFTMKRLAGTTLEDVLARGAQGTNELVRAFVDVCLAIDFAHARGVVHRDIKPANIMLGDYGEVYVLDWGVARIVAEADASASASLPADDSQTQAGAILGTPAYMAPEQMVGERVGPEADVYALGGVLFEILAGEPANPRTTLASRLALVSPAARRPDRAIAPELDAICRAALAPQPVDRPSARQLADRLRSYLDGDRDLAQRRQLAAEQLATARAAFASGDPARRGDAMAAAGRALALDPSSSDAAALVTQLMLEPPRELPASLADRLREHDVALVERQGRIAAANLTAYLGFIPLLLWAGVRDWSIVGAVWALIIITLLGSVAMARHLVHNVGWAIFANVVSLVLAARLFGSFVLLPALVLNASISQIAFPSLINRPLVVLGAMVTAFVLPLVLEATGVWSSTWWLVDGGIVTRPAAIELAGVAGKVLLIGGSLAVVIVTSLYVRSLALAQRAAARQLEIQAWHLRQLLPV